MPIPEKPISKHNNPPSETNFSGGIVLFDGVCNLCNHSVDFIMKRDKVAYFRYASLQSPLAQDLLQERKFKMQDMNSVLLIEGSQVYQKSSAALRIARRLGGAWYLLYAFIIVPPILRDFVYSWIAHNRYRWFGKRETCRLPSPEERKLFL